MNRALTAFSAEQDREQRVLQETVRVRLSEAVVPLLVLGLGVGPRVKREPTTLGYPRTQEGHCR